jgi:hypothetical protein
VKLGHVATQVLRIRQVRLIDGRRDGAHATADLGSILRNRFGRNLRIKPTFDLGTEVCTT